MRSRNHFVEREQRMIRRRRLLLKYIQRSASDDSLFDGCEQSALVYESTASAIDDANAAFHLRESSCADDAARLGGQRSVDREKVCAGEDFVKRRDFHLKIAPLIWRDARIIRQPAHADGTRAAGDDAPDSAQTDDAQSLALQLHPDETLALPAALP